MSDSHPIGVWYRGFDLRTADHPALQHAATKGSSLVTFFVWNTALEERTKGGFPRVGPARQRHLYIALEELNESLKSLGHQLQVQAGHPPDLVPALATALGLTEVVALRGTTHDEMMEEQHVQRALQSKGILLTLFEGELLFDRHTLPAMHGASPPSFTSFRKKIEKAGITPPSPLPAPTVLPPAIPYGRAADVPRGQHPQVAPPVDLGGCLTGRRHVHTYFEHPTLARTYKETRNGLVGRDYSTKFSIYLATGAVSAREIAHHLAEYEDKHGANESTYWILFELLWREYFKWIGIHVGARLFLTSGLAPTTPHSAHREGAVQGIGNMNLLTLHKWIVGETGIPFIDAAMIELRTTGYLSNRMRQNVASFLVHHLGVRWTLGALYFEHALVDYDPASNWGNWQYLAGVGTDPRNRIFNPIKQAKMYDPDGAYVVEWIPAFASIPPAYRHVPWLMPKFERPSWYPRPMLNPTKAFKMT